MSSPRTDLSVEPVINSATVNRDGLKKSFAVVGYESDGTEVARNRISSTSFNSRDAATLAAAATFQGVGEDVSKYGRVGVSITSDNATDGTLTMEVSRDNVNWGGPTRTWADTRFAQPHMWNIVEKYFRIKYVNGTTEATNLAIQVQYSNNANILLGHQLDETLLDETEAIVVRAVLVGKSGSGAYISPTVTNHRALQVTPPPEGRSSFGETLSVEVTPIVSMVFHTFINPITIATRGNQSGAVTNAQEMALCSTGAAANSSAAILSKTTARYKPGQGVRARFTGIFTTGVSGSTQIVGIGDEGNGFFFGYNGDTFGLLHRTGGVRKMETFTVTVAGQTAEDVTITLDGDTATDVTLTNQGADTAATRTLTANEIAAHDYSDVGRGWDAIAVGPTVIFTSWKDTPRTGTFSLSSSTTAVATVAETIAGVDPTDTWTAMTSWNGDDKFDGTGNSGAVLDPTKGNVFQINYQWLGFGSIIFYIEDPADGEFHKVHTIQYANANTRPSVARPTLGLRCSAENVANTTDIIIKTASMAAFVDGKDEYIGTRTGTKATITGASGGEPILTLRCNEVFVGKHNHGELKISIVGAAVEASGNNTVSIDFYANMVLTGAAFTSVNAGFSQAQVDTTASVATGGTFLFSIDLGKTGNDVINLKDDKYAALLTPGNAFTAIINPTGGTAEATVTFNYVDLF